MAGVWAPGGVASSEAASASFCPASAPGPGARGEEPPPPSSPFPEHPPHEPRPHLPSLQALAIFPLLREQPPLANAPFFVRAIALFCLDLGGHVECSAHTPTTGTRSVPTRTSALSSEVTSLYHKRVLAFLVAKVCLRHILPIFVCGKHPHSAVILKMPLDKRACLAVLNCSVSTV